MRTIGTLALLVGLLAAGCAASTPDGVLSGRIDATALGDLYPGAAFVLAAPGGATDVAGLNGALADALAARGIVIAADAPFVLDYRISATPATARLGLPEFGLAGVLGSNDTHDVGVSIELPFFGLGDQIRKRYRFAAEITVSRRDGMHLWRGRVHGLAATGDLDTIAAQVFPALLDHLGETVRSRAFDPGPHRG
ncbi:MAG: hypothetical protein ACE5H8_14090 [Alphaproteobacteria bacterium]